jgi:hypothetical protein
VTITNVRDPVDRILSAYEFTVEVAARGLNAPNKSLSYEKAKQDDKMLTSDIWPWSVLVR